MSDTKKTDAAEISEDTVAAFELETLRKDSVKLFGVTSSTFDGAMLGKTGPLSIDAASNIITNFLKGAVKK